MASVPSEAQSLKFESHGAPLEALELGALPLKPMGDADVCVRMIAAPVNPRCGALQLLVLVPSLAHRGIPGDHPLPCTCNEFLHK